MKLLTAAFLFVSFLFWGTTYIVSAQAPPLNISELVPASSNLTELFSIVNQLNASTSSIK